METLAVDVAQYIRHVPYGISNRELKVMETQPGEEEEKIGGISNRELKVFAGGVLTEVEEGERHLK